MPGAIPFTTPDEEPIRAVLALLVVHMPPESEREMTPPPQSKLGPTIGPGIGLTVTCTESQQPVAGIA